MDTATSPAAFMNTVCPLCGETIGFSAPVMRHDDDKVAHVQCFAATQRPDTNTRWWAIGSGGAAA
jgi:hypothetical protein